MSALESAPALVIDELLKSSNLIILDYRNKETFTDFWLHGLKSGKITVDDHEIDLTDATQQILIIGNDPPDDVFDTKIPSLAGINFRDHFTATSWLAAWKIKFSPSEQERKKGTTESLPRIAVVDPHVSGMTKGAAQALQTIFAARDADDHSLVPGVAVFNAPSLESICRWLNSSEADKTRTTPRHLRDLLKSTIWNELTSTSEQHHALSNILAPVVLSDRPEADSSKLSHQTLLRRLLSACGLFSWVDFDQNAASPEDNIRKKKKPAENGQGLSILLLDDQAEQGWEDWVKECLPGAVSAIKSQVDPTSLIDAICKAIDLEGDNPERDARFTLSLPGFEQADSPVLLLDLRLFSGNPKNELKFYKEKLLPLVYHYMDQDNLAWPGFNSSDPAFKRALDAVENGQLVVDSEEHHEMLTWLPRIVAMADMSLPLIIFSSTGRRGLLEPFKPYGNIITTFEKPRLTDLVAVRDENDLSNIGAIKCIQLKQAFGAARRWLMGRDTVSHFRNIDLQELEKTRKAFEDKTHLEIYHDESGKSSKPFFQVASLLAGFKNKDDASNYDSGFPVRFYGRGREPKRASKDKDERKIALQKEVDRWTEKIYPALSYSDSDVSPELIFSLAARDKDTPESGAPDSLFDPEGLDNVNWDLLKLLWESLICDVIPSLLQNKLRDEIPLSIHIYGATRMRPVALEAKDASSAIRKGNKFLDQLKERWGLNLIGEGRCYVREEGNEADVSFPDYRNNKLIKNSAYKSAAKGNFHLLWSSLGSGSFSRIVSEILFARRGSLGFTAICQAIEKATGVSLTYDEKPAEARHLHYIADIMGGITEIDPWSARAEMLNDSQFTSIRKKGCMSFRKRLIGILNSNRMLDIDNCNAEAIAIFYGLPHNHPDDLAYLSLVDRLNARLDDLNGEDMARVVGFINEPPKWMDEANRLLTPDRIQPNSALKSDKKSTPKADVVSAKKVPFKAVQQSKYIPQQVFIGGLPLDCDKEKLKSALKAYNITCAVKFISQKDETGFAFLRIIGDLNSLLEKYEDGIELFGNICHMSRVEKNRKSES